MTAAQRTTDDAFQDVLLERTGLRLFGGRAVSLLGNLKASQAMFTDFQTVSSPAGIKEMRQAAAASGDVPGATVGATSTGEVRVSTTVSPWLRSSVRTPLGSKRTVSRPK